MDYLRKQPTNQRPFTGDAINQHTFRPRIQTWHAGDYREVFLYLSATKYGFVWRAVEQGKLLERGIAILTKTEPQADMEQQAFIAARTWIRANVPDAKIRVRSALERAALFTNQQIMEGTRRLAA
jgi:hypothetical protein